MVRAFAGIALTLVSLVWGGVVFGVPPEIFVEDDKPLWPHTLLAIFLTLLMGLAALAAFLPETEAEKQRRLQQ